MSSKVLIVSGIAIAIALAVLYGAINGYFESDKSQNLVEILDDSGVVSDKTKASLSEVESDKDAARFSDEISYRVIRGERIGTPQDTVYDISETDAKLYELYVHALSLVNKDRMEHGLKPVKLGGNGAAQAHADDMLQKKYYSHWYSDNVKPYVAYTKMGGRASVSENIAKTTITCPSNNCLPHSFDPKKEIEGYQYRMMYDDAESDWGHRDTILGPHHITVNFGVAYDDDNFYFVQHFETHILRLNSVRMVTDSVFGLDAQIPPEYFISNIAIYEDPKPKQLAATTLNNQPPYNIPYYDQGELVGLLVPILPPNKFYQECSPGMIKTTDEKGNLFCVMYETYKDFSQNPERINIEADVSQWLKRDGLHTIYLVLENANTGEKVTAISITLEYLES